MSDRAKVGGCDVCCKAIIRGYDHKTFYRFAAKVEDLSSECFLCGMILNQIRKGDGSIMSITDHTPELMAKYLWNVMEGFKDPADEGEIHVRYTEIEHVRYLEVLNKNSIQDVNVMLSFVRRNDKRVNGEKKFDLMKEWLSTSLASNPLKNTGEKSRLPTRVLDVSGGKLKLHISALGERADYITLSYRWGSSHLFQTTRDTLDAHCKGIDFKALPKTLQDAITVTRALDTRYLWIDALCIIQQDAADFEKEAPLMGNIYHNSICSLAAQCAKDHNDGFLEKALKGPKTKMVYMQVETSRGSEISWMKPTLRSPGNFAQLIDNGPLSKRGWVFQERILSSRIIHFAEREIFWEDMNGLKGELGSLYDNKTPLSAAREELYRIKNDISQFTAGDWFQLIEKYTYCDLTKASDRLPALAGITSRLAQSCDDFESPCYSGLWVNQLPYGLMWVPHQIARYPTPADMPSWSWASYGGGVFYNEDEHSFEEFEPSMEVLDIKTASGAGGMKGKGKIISGPCTLTIRTKLAKIPALNVDTGCPRCKDGEIESSHYCAYIVIEEKQRRGRIQFDRSEDKGGEAFPNNLVGMLVGVLKYEQQNVYHFLVVAPTGAPEAEYRRIGTGKIRVADWFRASIETTVHLV